MKLELKHLAPYLPYGLNCYNEMHKRKEILNIVIKDGIKECTVSHLFDYYFYKIKPILRPLSDLTKAELKAIEYPSKLRLIHDLKYGYVQYYIMQELFKKKVDVFGLIEKGLAIDINTL
jgi:hypothetical protein